MSRNALLKMLPLTSICISKLIFSRIAISLGNQSNIKEVAISEQVSVRMKFSLLLQFLLVLICQQLCLANFLLEHEQQGNDNVKVLSRKRRFLVPSTTGWKFTTSFSVNFPLQGLDTSFTGSVPFSYSFNLTG